MTAIILSIFLLFAADEGYRYQNGACVNGQGESGYNPEFFGECGDFRFINISDQQIEDVNMDGSRFDGASLTNVQFNNVDLNGSAFIGTNFFRTDFSNLTLSDSSFFGAAMNMVTLDTVIMDLANMSKLNADTLVIQNVEMTNTSFAESEIRGLEFVDSITSDVQFVNTRLQDVTISGVRFTKGSFSDSYLVRAVIENITYIDLDLSRSISIDGQWNNWDGEKLRLHAAELDTLTINSEKLTRTDFRDSIFFDTELSESTDISGSFYNELIEGISIETFPDRGAKIFREC